MSAKRLSIAAQLTKRLGGEWRAVRDGFGWRWVGPDGRTVRAYAQPVLGFDGYSDTEFLTVYIDNEGWQVGAQGLITAGPFPFRQGV